MNQDHRKPTFWAKGMTVTNANLVVWVWMIRLQVIASIGMVAVSFALPDEPALRILLLACWLLLAGTLLSVSMAFQIVYSRGSLIESKPEGKDETAA